MKPMTDLLQALKHQLIVSVQAEGNAPLNTPEHLSAMAQTVVLGGARVLRTAQPDNIRAIKTALPHIPLIGLTKPEPMIEAPNDHVYITPTLADALQVVEAGADIVALDATNRPRPGGELLATIVTELKQQYPHNRLMADVATLDDGLRAAELGFDIVGTTLAGYTTDTVERARCGEPDMDLLRALVAQLPCPVVLEGRVWTPEQVRQGFEAGAWAVVVGSAITRPHQITQRFLTGIPQHSRQ